EWRKRKAVEEEERAVKEKRDELDREATAVTARNFGVEVDPLQESDDEEGKLKFSDDGRSGHEWLRESSESLVTKGVLEQKKEDKASRRQERKRLEDEEKANTENERPRRSLWDRFTWRATPSKRSPSMPKAKEPSLIDMALRTPRYQSLPPPSPTTPSSPGSKSSKSKRPTSSKSRSRQRSNAANQETDESNASLSTTARTQSSTRLNDDVRKWRTASRERLSESARLRRPSNHPIHLPPLAHTPSQGRPYRRRSSARVLSTADYDTGTTDAETPRRPKKVQTPKKVKIQSVGLFGSADAMPMAPVLDAFDVEKARREIAKRLESSLRPPGAPLLSISPVFTEHPTEYLQCPKMGGHEGLSFHEYWSERKYFRLDVPRKMKELAQGVGLDANLDSKRLTLMKKRFRKEGIVKGPIPFDDKDITDDLYEKVANPLEDDVIALALWKPKSAQDTKSIHDTNTNLGFLKRIRMHQLIQRARQGRAPRVQDFVREERVVEVEATESFLLSFFLPKRPLKPNRISRFARVTSQPEDGCKISVKVLQGFNVP
ncbi:hypothetical protein HDU80_003046, partial [Chytriomyces hyalinus]